MKVCILSDSHDHIPRLQSAAEQAADAGAQAILHCGDIVAPGILNVLKPVGLPVHLIHGNNLGDPYQMQQIAADSNGLFNYYGQDAAVELAGRRIFLVHFPHYARAMAATGDWDLVCCGHTHEAKIEHVTHVKGGQTPVVNPGSVGGTGAPATYILAELTTLQFEICELAA